MKKVFLMILLLLAMFCQAQDEKLLGILPLKEGKVYYSEVVDVDSTTSKELYNRAKRWVVGAYKSTKDVLQLDDAENGELVIKGNFSTIWKSSFMSALEISVRHTIRIFLKDNKYKYEFTDFVLSGYNPPSRYTSGGSFEYNIEDWGKARKQNARKYYTESVEPEIDQIITSLKKGMKRNADKADW